MSPLDNLPSTLLSAFNTTYDGFRAAVFASAVEANNAALALKTHNISFKQKTIKRKRKANTFVGAVSPTAQTTSNTNAD